MMRGVLALLLTTACNCLHQHVAHRALFKAAEARQRQMFVQQSDMMQQSNAWLRRPSSALLMSSTEAESSEQNEKTKAGKKDKGDFSVFAVGQQYDGQIMSAKVFGVFVDISAGYNVLIPKSKMSAGNYNKLKEMADSKSTDKVKIELISVDAGNQTLSAKYIDPNFRERKTADLSQFTEGQTITGTIVSTHEFGCFVSLKDFDVDGLLPMSKMRGMTPAKGMELDVKIDTIDKEKNKLVLALAKDPVTAAPIEGTSPEKWLQGIVNSVTNFGLFVRPAGLDMVGLVHNSRVPRELIFALKKRSPVPAGTNKTDVEALFQAGDVVKVRINGMQGGKTELSMLKYSAADDDEDDYVVEGRDPEVEEGKFQEESAEEEDETHYDAEDTLLWWKGQPYVKAAMAEQAVDEEEEVIMENSAVVEGTWRRMFEVDMREDQADFSTKVKEAELKELEEEIGELIGLDDDMIEMGSLTSASFQQAYQQRRVGSFVSMNAMPDAWKAEIDFFQQSKEVDENKIAALRRGKVQEQSEFEALLREVEVELQSSQPRQRVQEPEASPAESQAVPAAAPAEVEAPADAPAE